MANYLIKEETLTAIADAIRNSNATSSAPIIEDEYTLSETDLDSGLVEIFYHVIDEADNVAYDGPQGWQLVAYTYGPDIDGDQVPIIFKLYDDSSTDIDYDEPFYYSRTDVGPDGEIYDWWVKDEAEGDYTQTSIYKKYILTNCIVNSGNNSTANKPMKPTEMPSRIMELNIPKY